VGRPVPDVAAPTAKVFRIGADPGAELRLTEIATGARPSCDTRPGLRSRPLGRRSGCPSTEPYSPPRPFFSLRPSCLHPTSYTARPVKSPAFSLLPQQAIALREDPCTEPGEFLRRRDISERSAHAAKPTNAVPFPLISIGGERERPCHAIWSGDIQRGQTPLALSPDHAN
jgi:hypothetical protein